MDSKKIGCYRGGIPYEPDVKKLEEAFPILEEGMEIDYETIEAIVQCKRVSSRFDGVVTSWRHKLLKRGPDGIDTKRNGTGVRVLFPDERFEEGGKDMDSHARGFKRGFRRKMRSPRDRLDDIGKKKYDHAALVGLKTVAALDAGRKEMRLDLPPAKSLPRPKLVTGNATSSS